MAWLRQTFADALTESTIHPREFQVSNFLNFARGESPSARVRMRPAAGPVRRPRPTGRCWQRADGTSAARFRRRWANRINESGSTAADSDELLATVTTTSKASPQASVRGTTQGQAQQGTCDVRIELRPVPNAKDPRRKRLSESEPRGLTAPASAGRWTWARTARGSTRQAAPLARHMRHSHRAGPRLRCE